MDIINSRHYERFRKTITRANKPISIKLAKILSYVANYLGIDKKKYFISGSYALNNYYKYKEINNLNVNMDPSEFKLLKNFELGEFIKSNNFLSDEGSNVFPSSVWLLDLTNLYNELNDDKIDNFYIEIFEMPEAKGYPNDNFSLNSLEVSCGLEVDKYGQNYFTVPMFYKWKKTLDRPIDQKDIKFIKKYNLVEIEKPEQCGGYNKYHTKYIKYKTKYMNLKNMI